MRLLLVDDDKFVIETMTASFPWNDWGITELRTAWSVRQAREILTREQVDILLCDIEMPMGSGIELLEWIREEISYPIVTILLTCHSEFRYAQRALQLGCSNYLLKPAEEAELKKAVLDAEEKVMELKKREQERRRREQKIGNMDAFWEVLLAHRISTGKKLEQVCEEYEVDREQSFLPVLVSVKHHSRKIRDVSRSLMSFILENVIREMFRGQEFALVNNYNEKLWMFFPEYALNVTMDPECDLKEKLEQTVGWMQENYHCALSCYMGQMQPLTAWQSEYEQLREADEYFAVSPRVYPPADIRRRHPFPFECSDSARKNFLNLFSAGRYDDLLQSVREYFSAFTPQQCSAASLGAAIRRMDQEFDKLLDRETAEQFQKLQVCLLEENPDYLRSIPGMLEYYERLFGGLKQQKGEKEPEALMKKVKLFISMNMQQEIGREEVAAHVGLNSDYLNRIFKKETGRTLKEYIADEKIKMACELLEQTDFLVGEIGEMVGYVNFSSFSTFFKNRTGTTPAAWRKEHGGCRKD